VQQELKFKSGKILIQKNKVFDMPDIALITTDSDELYLVNKSEITDDPIEEEEITA